ncbi:hypothetical protein AB1L30_06170 [Bremerella sp. JC817]|uniref:hypothetical protein n=1 Tax=Bremerella sp. JC817 TaxID=3231756 RepID=UPI00345A360A
MRSVALSIGLLALATLGCTAAAEPEEPRFQVSGVVTLDGKPLDAGQIIFDSPEQAAKGIPPVMAEIQAGKYSLSVPEGTKTVKITHMVEVGKEEITGDPIMKEEIPAKYNRNSKLTAQVDKKENTENFDL